MKMSLCLCKSSLKEGHGGEGFAFHPLYFFSSCPVHPTSGERLQQSDFHGIDFEPPVIRIWSLDDYFSDTTDDSNHTLSESHFLSEASSSPEHSGSQSRTSMPSSSRSAETEERPVDIQVVQERKSNNPDASLADKAPLSDHVKSSLPTEAHTQQAVPDQNDWERYKDVIEDLYMRQNLNLSQVRNVMESNYGIRAT